MLPPTSFNISKKNVLQKQSPCSKITEGLYPKKPKTKEWANN